MRYFLVAIITLLLYACGSSENNKQVIRGFYYWKSIFDPDNSQLEFLDKIGAEVIYLKYFDVVYNGYECVPEAEVKIELDDLNLNLVPVIFITPDVFSKIDSTDIQILADNIAAKIKRIHVGPSPKEIQFDYDWTPSTKDKYFAFLQEIKQFFPKAKISATIRLYQYKYPDLAGVPPVDKGLLMYYNMGSLKDYDETNSILNNEKGKQYLGFNEYPLPMDIALPNFKWGLLFRQGRFEQICNEFTEDQLKNNLLFSHSKNNYYTFKKDTVMYNTYFRFGDELRFESCSEEELLIAAELLKKEMNQEKTTILIYDLQPNTHLEYEKINTVFNTFDQQ